MTNIAATAVILAAGESSRMGQSKPLLPLGKKPVLDHAVETFHTAGIFDIRVVTGHQGDKIRKALSTLEVKWIHNEVYRQGMLSSIKKGLESIPRDKKNFFLLPVDIPLIRPRTLEILLEEWPVPENGRPILYPTFAGERGHPPLISTNYIPDIMKWDRQDGLRMFLAQHDADAMDIPVIDEYILKDMDTLSEYESLVAAWQRNNIPTPAECTAMLDNPAFFSGQTAAHCRAVAELAGFLGRRLAPNIDGIDPERIFAAALLHDVAKGQSDHAGTGAHILTKLGFSGIADIVASHMDISVTDTSPITDREVVYLADKLVKGDKPVPLQIRFDDKLARHGHDSAARAAILKRKADTLAVVRRIEKKLETSMEEIFDDYLSSQAW